MKIGPLNAATMASLFGHPGHAAPQPKRRKRKPSLGSVVRQAARAGLPVASYTINADWSVTVQPGTPLEGRYNITTLPDLDGGEGVNPWDTVLHVKN